MIVNNELERMRKETVVTHYFGICLEEIDRNRKKLENVRIGGLRAAVEPGLAR
jgi:hypothetical protein